MIPGSIRNILEGLVFAVLFPAWLTIALLSAAVGRLRGRIGCDGVLGSALRRWGVWVTSGTRTFRRAWWPLPNYEGAVVFWRHMLLTELFAGLNQGGGHGKKRERYLVIKLAHIGDAMHIGPMLAELRRSKPDAEIDILVGPWCRDLARRWKLPGRVWVYTPHLQVFRRGTKKGLLGIAGEIRFLYRLRRRRYSCAISTSTLSMAEWMLIHAANPGFWVGAANPVMPYYREVPSRTEPYHSSMYEADRVGGLLRYIDIPAAGGRPEFPLQEDERRWAAGQWGDARLKIVMAPGAGWPGKMWPADRFAEMARRFSALGGVKIVVTGSPDEKALGESVVADVPNTINLAGSTSFGQTAALVESADLLLCNDSGPLHLAAAYGTPSVALFGPTVAGKWQPPGGEHLMIQKQGFCEGCVGWHPNAACVHDNACMKAISVDEVWGRIAGILKQTERVTGHED